MSTRNRGKNSEDDVLFGSEKVQSKLSEAIQDMHFLLNRGYAEKASSELVGNRYRLKSRQIQMIRGASASESQIVNRKNKELSLDDLQNQTINVDGFNVLIILESLLSKAYIFQGLDDCYRDLSGVHGTYKRVNQTFESINLVSSFFKLSKAEKLVWIFDKPVSNSGRIKQHIIDMAQENNLNWEVKLEYNPDQYLAKTSTPIVSSDAWVLDHCQKGWFNVIDFLIKNQNLDINLFTSTK